MKRSPAQAQVTGLVTHLMSIGLSNDQTADVIKFVGKDQVQFCSITHQSNRSSPSIAGLAAEMMYAVPSLSAAQIKSTFEILLGSRAIFCAE